MINSPKAVLLGVLCAALMTGCGVRGSLDKPQATASAPAETASDTDKPSEDADRRRSDGFVLDRLIQ